MTPKILVFIPMYNCQSQIPRVLAQLEDPRVAARVNGVLCVDNRSGDGTRDAALAGLARLDVKQKMLLHNDDNYGLGGSHKVAIQTARTEGYTHLIVLHGDDQGSIADILPYLEDGSFKETDFLMGARFMKGSRLEGYSVLRTLANHVFNTIFSVISGGRLYDLGSGLNLFSLAAFKDDFHLRYADDLTFNYYLILGVVHKSFGLRFFPLTWREDDQVSNARLARMGGQLLRIIGGHLSGARAFLAAEHRAVPRTSYPSTPVTADQGPK